MLAGVHRDPERLDLRAQDLPAALVHLHGHQPRRELDHVRLETHVVERVGRLETEESATDHHSDAGLRRVGADRLQIVDGAVDEAALRLAPLYGRNQR